MDDDANSYHSLGGFTNTSYTETFYFHKFGVGGEGGKKSLTKRVPASLRGDHGFDTFGRKIEQPLQGVFDSFPNVYDAIRNIPPRNVIRIPLSDYNE